MGKCACIKLMVAIRKKLQYKHYDEKKKKKHAEEEGAKGRFKDMEFSRVK